MISQDGYGIKTREGPSFLYTYSVNVTFSNNYPTTDLDVSKI